MWRKLLFSVEFFVEGGLSGVEEIFGGFGLELSVWREEMYQVS